MQPWQRNYDHPTAHDLKRIRPDGSSTSTGKSIAKAFKSIFKSSKARREEEEERERERELERQRRHRHWQNERQDPPRPPKKFKDLPEAERNRWYLNVSHLDDEQFRRTDVAMEVEGEIIRDHLSASHSEIQRRIKESNPGPEGTQEAEEHLLATPPILPTKHIPSNSPLRNSLANINFQALVARDKSLHGLENDLQALREWWETNQVLWTENKKVVNDINDTIRQYQYQLSARGLGASMCFITLSTSNRRFLRVSITLIC
jgi:hypothetical protein